MRTYTPLWSKIVDSSLWSEPDIVVKVFLTLLAKKDSHHEVHANAYEIAGWARKSEQEVIDALKVLSSPDTRRIEPQPFEGRRIERVKDGWKILNGQFYRDLIRKEYQRQKQAEYRARPQLQPNSSERAFEQAEARGDFDLADKLTEPRKGEPTDPGI